MFCETALSKKYQTDCRHHKNVSAPVSQTCTIIYGQKHKLFLDIKYQDLWTFTSLWANSADDKLMVFFFPALFIVCGDNY